VISDSRANFQHGLIGKVNPQSRQMFLAPLVVAQVVIGVKNRAWRANFSGNLPQQFSCFHRAMILKSRVAGYFQ
jgi:hypothetical protein